MYTLYQDTPYVEVTWSTDGKRAAIQAEGGWLAFPFAVEQPRFHLGRTGAVVNPATDFVKNTNHDYYFLKTAQLCTLRDEPVGEAFPIRNGSITVQVKPYQPVSLLLR